MSYASAEEDLGWESPNYAELVHQLFGTWSQF